MISASESPPSAANEAEACGVVAAISMPRSSAAVLTLVPTPWWPESFAVCVSDGGVELLASEGDRGGREDLGSGAMQKKKKQPGRRRSRARTRPCRRLGYHGGPPRRNPAFAETNLPRTAKYLIVLVPHREAAAYIPTLRKMFGAECQEYCPWECRACVAGRWIIGISRRIHAGHGCGGHAQGHAPLRARAATNAAQPFALIPRPSIELKVCCPQCVAASRILPILN